MKCPDGHEVPRGTTFCPYDGKKISVPPAHWKWLTALMVIVVIGVIAVTLPKAFGGKALEPAPAPTPTNPSTATRVATPTLTPPSPTPTLTPTPISNKSSTSATVTPATLTPIPSSLTTPSTSIKEVFQEGFEKGNLQNWETLSVGQVPIAVSKEDAYSGVFGLKIGPSSCSASCFDNYKVSFKPVNINLSEGEYIISYYRRESRDWGGMLRIFVNGMKIGEDPGKYSNQSKDSGWYENRFAYVGSIKSLLIEETDLTSGQPIFLDDIRILAVSSAPQAVALPAPTPSTTPVSSSSGDSTLINQDPRCIQPPAGLVGWYPGEGNTDDIHGRNNGTLLGGLGFSKGIVGQGFTFSADGQGIKIPPSDSLNLRDAITIEAWVNPAFPLKVGPIVEYNVGKGDAGEFAVHFWLFPTPDTLMANLVDTNGTGHGIEVSGVMVANQFQHVSVTYSKSSGIAKLYHNGKVVQQRQLGAFSLSTAGAINIGFRDEGSSNRLTFRGIIDEVSIYNRSLNDKEIQAVYAAGNAAKCKTVVPTTFAGAPPTSIPSPTPSPTARPTPTQTITPTPAPAPSPGPTPIRVSAPRPVLGPALAYGDMVSGSIDPAGEVDVYVFKAKAGDVALIAGNEPCCRSYSLQVEVFDPQGKSLAKGFATSNNSMVRLSPTLTADGNYTVRVQKSTAETAPYTLVLKNLASSAGIAVTYGDAVTADISPAGDVDIYTFLGKVGDVALIAGNEPCCRSYSLQVEVLDPQGKSLAKGSATSNDSMVRLSPTLTAGGNYTVRVQKSTAETAPYTLVLKNLALGPATP